MRFFKTVFIFIIAYQVWEAISFGLGWDEPTALYSASTHLLLATAYFVIYILFFAKHGEDE